MSISSVRNALNGAKSQIDNPALFNLLSNILDEITALQDSRIIDSGSGFTKSTDTNGTRINFNETYKSCVVIAVVRDTGGDGYCTIITKANTFFQVAARNNVGTRISAIIDWIAIGVLQ